jgi:heptosyltransferase-2
MAVAILAAIAGIPRRIGYARDGRSFLLTDRLATPRHAGNFVPVAAIDYYLGLADYLGCPSVDRQMTLTVEASDQKLADKLWRLVGFESRRRTIVINNSAATCPSRLWSESRQIELIKKLLRHPDLQILIHCGPQEKTAANQLASSIYHRRVQSMGQVTDLPLGLSFAVMSRADAVISTDSGARAIAVACNRPVVSLFGSTKPAWTRTYNVPELTLQAEFECVACRKTPPGRNNSGPNCNCMERITVDQVYRAVMTQLESNPAEWSSRAA